MQAPTEESLEFLSDYMGSIYTWAYRNVIDDSESSSDDWIDIIKNPNASIFHENDFPSLNST